MWQCPRLRAQHLNVDFILRAGADSGTSNFAGDMGATMTAWEPGSAPCSKPPSRRAGACGRPRGPPPRRVGDPISQLSGDRQSLASTSSGPSTPGHGDHRLHTRSLSQVGNHKNRPLAPVAPIPALVPHQNVLRRQSADHALELISVLLVNDPRPHHRQHAARPRAQSTSHDRIRQLTSTPSMSLRRLTSSCIGCSSSFSRPSTTRRHEEQPMSLSAAQQQPPRPILNPRRVGSRRRRR